MSKGVVYTEISGFPELLSKINRLESDPQKVTEIRNILRKVAGSTVKVAKSLAPVSKKAHVARGVRYQPGNLRKSIGTITGKNRINPTIFVGARAKNSYDGWYAHFVHEGVNTYRKGYKRKRSKGANNAAATGRSQRNRFFRKAEQITGSLVSSQAESQVAKYFQKRINALSR